MLVVVLVLAGCGGGSKEGDAGRPVAGEGFAVQVRDGWSVRRGVRSLTAKNGAAIVSVTVFPLVKRFESQMFASVVPELDRVAAQLAAREGAKLSSSRTEKIAGRDARVYDLSRAGVAERIGFVLAGRREYQLYCRPTGDPCDLLFSSFSLGR